MRQHIHSLSIAYLQRGGVVYGEFPRSCNCCTQSCRRFRLVSQRVLTAWIRCEEAQRNASLVLFVARCIWRCTFAAERKCFADNVNGTYHPTIRAYFLQRRKEKRLNRFPFRLLGCTGTISKSAKSDCGQRFQSKREEVLPMSEILFALGLVSGIASAVRSVLALLQEYKRYRRIVSDK